MMDCRDCRERLSDLLEDHFASNEASLRAELRSHLETCAACRHELEVLRAIRADLRAFTEVSAPKDLRARVRAQLIQEKAANTPKAPFLSSLRLPRLALSGGAVLAACCLLLMVNSSSFFNSPTPGEQNSEPLTAENFRVRDEAFGETPQEKAQRKAAENAKKTAKPGKKSQARPVNPSTAASSPGQAFSGATSQPGEPAVAPLPEIEIPAPRLSDSSDTTEVKKPTRGEVPLAPRIARNSKVAEGGGADPEVKNTQQKSALRRGVDQGDGNETSVKLVAPGTSNPAGRDVKPETSPSTFAAGPNRPQGITGERGPSGPQGPAGLAALDKSNGLGVQSGAEEPLMAEAVTPKNPDATNQIARRAARPELPLENRTNSATGSLASGAGQNAAPPVGAPTPPSALMADAGAASGFRANNPANSTMPGLVRTPGKPLGHSALTTTRITPMAQAAQKADYVFTLGTTQVINLSFVPEKDAPLAQLRMTLPPGLRFSDETNAEPNQKNQTVPKSEGKSTSRLLWRGPIQKGEPIENALELKAIAEGRHTVLLSLESLDGKPLQMKSVLFQIQEVQAPEKLKAAPGETK